MKNIEQIKIPVVLEENSEEKAKYKIVREHDGMTRYGHTVWWIEWNSDGTYKKHYISPGLNRSLILDQHMGTYTWMTTTITKIVEEREDYVKFKTENSVYELFIS